jgi:hypothetical protein
MLKAIDWIGRMKSVFHYTDEEGFRALSSGSVWFPSAGRSFVSGESLAEYLHRAIVEAVNSFFTRQFETHDFNSARSSLFPDVDYGPGWYVTETPPTTPTDVLIDELWQGRQDRVHRTGYWLRLLTAAQRLKVPDVTRSAVAYLPVYNGLGFDNTRPAGINTEPVWLAEGGIRREGDSGQQVVTQLFAYSPPILAIPSMVTAIDGWSTLGPDRQCNFLGYLGYDSGFPGVSFPEGVAELKLSRNQYLAITQIAIRSLGTGFELRKVTDLECGQCEETFSFDVVGNLTLGEGPETVLFHCRQQLSPMRLEHARELVERAMKCGATVVFAFVTSTFGRNTQHFLRDTQVAPVLVTTCLSEERLLQTLRVSILDGEAIEYPDHDYWIPVHSGENARFERVRSRQQVLNALGRLNEA